AGPATAARHRTGPRRRPGTAIDREDKPDATGGARSKLVGCCRVEVKIVIVGPYESTVMDSCAWWILSLRLIAPCETAKCTRGVDVAAGNGRGIAADACQVAEAAANRSVVLAREVGVAPSDGRCNADRGVGVTAAYRRCAGCRSVRTGVG